MGCQLLDYENYDYSMEFVTVNDMHWGSDGIYKRVYANEMYDLIDLLKHIKKLQKDFDFKKKSYLVTGYGHKLCIINNIIYKQIKEY